MMGILDEAAAKYQELAQSNIINPPDFFAAS